MSEREKLADCEAGFVAPRSRVQRGDLARGQRSERACTMRASLASFGACALIAALSSTAAAQAVPSTVTFTARIADNGVPATGSHDLGFALFSGPTGGTAVWSEGPVSVTLADGLVYHELGSATTLDETILAGAKMYLELTVDGTTLSPRVAIVSVPYAIRAGDSNTLGGLMPGDFITGVTAGAGLTGGGSTGDVSVGVTFGGSGTATTVSRSDHNHTGAYLPVGTSLACIPGSFVSSILPSGDIVCTTPSAGGDTTPDTIADDGVIALGIETSGTFDDTPDTIGDDGTITLGTETTGAYDNTADTVGDDGVIDDLEASDNLSLNNGRLFAPGGAGAVGIGTTTPNGPFQISSRADIINSCGGAPLRTNANALVFQTDPGGGCGDHAFINYSARSGEAMTLEIANVNDPDDNILLTASGRVIVNSQVASAGGKFFVAADPSATPTNDGFEDNTLAPFTTSGAAWFVVTDTVSTGLPEGTHFATNGDIGDGGSTSMSYAFTATEPSTVAFWQKVSSEGGYDYLRFYIDGAEQLAWSGESGWQRLSYIVQPGAHTLTWTYSKDGSLSYGSDSAYVDHLLIQTFGGNNAITTMGRVGIGVPGALDMLHVGGDIRVGTGTVGCVKDADGTAIAGTCSSDARLKTNITPFTPMLERVTQLQPVEYDWRAKEFPDRGFGTERTYGLIAQDVEKLFPDMVAEDAQGYKAVNYSKLPLVMLQALKEEHARNDRLESRLNELERKLAIASTPAPSRRSSPVMPMALGAAGALALGLLGFALRRNRRS
jgi:hypothetical protein